MSLCRFSSMNWRCDLYCYYDRRGGITTHVAGNRIVGDIPETPDISDPKFLKAHQKQMAFLETAKREKIDLPLAGKTFNDSDLASFKDRLRELKELGYKFPEYLFDEVEELDSDVIPMEE